MSSIGFQRCPICQGTGRLESLYVNYTGDKCDVCNGKKIINILTGLPPNYE